MIRLPVRGVGARTALPLSPALALLAAGLVPAPARAQNVIGPASDSWSTQALSNTMERHFDSGSGGVPLPAGFFGPGSDPFDGVINFHGVPLEGTPPPGIGEVGLPGQPDTIVRRLTTAVLPGCPSSAIVPIEIVALDLVSIQPITVTFGGGAAVTTWEVEACLSSTVAQAQGQMQIFRENIGGGRFTSFLPVRPKLVFTRCTGTAGLPSVTMDPAPASGLNGNGVWSYNNLGLPVMTLPGGVVDHDCNAATGMAPYPPSSNFFPGVHSPGATCAGPGGPPDKAPTAEQEMLAAHGVLPPNRPPGTGYCFGDGTGIACPCGNLGAVGHGCEHSGGFGGGQLYGNGDAKLSADTLVLRARDLPTNTVALFFQGTVALGGGSGVVFGDGIRCVGGSQIRLGIEFAACGKVQYGGPVGDVPVSIKGAIPAVLGTFFYQVWFRDAAAFCTPFTFNLTNGYQIPWLP